jgi:nucleoside-diphosphate-sugar epimerase
MAQLTVVVTGSTGKQGGAVARGLLGRGHKVRAVTRDPNSSQAKLLANAGAALVVASLEDTAAITKALEGAISLFAMTMPLDVIRQHMGEDAVRMYQWFDRVGFAVDRAALRREFPDVAFHDFESWAKAQDWNAILQSA